MAIMILPSNEIHLWCVYDEVISTTTLLSEYRRLLNKEETEQQAHFHFWRNRHQYLITRVLVRVVLSQYLPKIPPTDLIFKNNQYGKPYLDNSPLPFPLEFNISHSRELVVLTITNGLKVGVDVQHTLCKNDVISIADHFFSPGEVEALKSLEPNKQYDRFFDLWTLKEAYIKAKGVGLSIPLDKFSFGFDNDAITISFDGENVIDNPDHWTFWQLKPTETHKIAIAVMTNNFEGKNLTLKMQETIPLMTTTAVNYPIIRYG